MSETHLTTTTTTHQKRHPEDGRISGRSVLVKTLRIQILLKSKVQLLVVNNFINLINTRNMEGITILINVQRSSRLFPS